MKGIIIHCSGTGNTALAAEYIGRRLSFPFEVVSLREVGPGDLEQADVVGFATWTDFGGVPQVFESFIGSMPSQTGKPAFALNTFGAMSGKTLRILVDEVSEAGFQVFAGHSLHMPENYPPLLSGRMASTDAPSPAEVGDLDAFVAEIDRQINVLAAGGSVGPYRPRLGLADSVVPRRPRKTAWKRMGRKSVDATKCTACGLCVKGCPYGATTLGAMPRFAEEKCYGCWKCYNSCPSKAIHAGKFRGTPTYPGPSALLREKLM